mgnify:CR=1 FL=1
MYSLDTYSRLFIDLTAIQNNYRYLQRMAGAAHCAAVLKADAYGLGAAAIAPVLYQEGCRHFFVAYTEEALTLKQVLKSSAAKIYVLNGPYTSASWPALYEQEKLIPVLNTLADLQVWHAHCTAVKQALPAALHINTNMHRLGLPWSEYETLQLCDYPYLNLCLVMSHLSCAEDSNHAANLKQLRQIREIRKAYPTVPISLGSSGGIFLSPAYHFDMVRPGIALYGLAGTPGALSSCLHLQAKILQIQDVEAGSPIGYGETFIADRPMRVACLSIGYGDGVPWRLTQHPDAHVLINGQKAPIVGRISMDLMTIDVTTIPNVQTGNWATLLDDTLTAQTWAEWAQMISYEMSLNLGKRIQRVYTQPKSLLTAETASC